MIKRKLISLFSILLALLLLLSACGGNTDLIPPTTDAEETETTGESETETPAEEQTPLGQSTLEVSGNVTDVDVIQVMGKGMNSETGELFSMDRHVAGKNTVVRVVFNSETEVSQDGSMQLTVSKDGKELVSLLPLSGEGNYALFAPKNPSDVDNWSAGEYTFNFAGAEGTGVRTSTFQEGKKIKVLAVPVIANYNGRVVSCEGEWQTAIQFTQDTYPLASNGIEYVLGNELDLSGSEYNLMSDEGGYNVWQALCNLQTPSNDYELILGFVRERQGQDQTIQGFTYGKPSNIITESDGDMQPTVAHEIAHCYDVGDEYPGGAINNMVNPAPMGMEGSDYNNREQSISGNKAAVVSATEFGSRNTGSIVRPEQFAYNAAQQSTLNNVSSFMGSGSDQLSDYWITSDIWIQLFKHFVSGDVTPQYSSEGSDTTPQGSDNQSSDNQSSGNQNTTGEGYTCPKCGVTSATSDYAYYAPCTNCGVAGIVDLNADSFDCTECGQKSDIVSQNLFMVCPQCEDYFQPNMNQKQAMQKTSGETAQTQEAEVKETGKMVQAIDLSGLVYQSGNFKAEPWYSYETDAAYVNSVPKSDYAVVFENAAGKQLSKQFVKVSFTTNSNPPKKNDFAPLNATLLYPKDTTAIKIFSGTKEIYSCKVSPNAPEVEFLPLPKNMSGKQTISWKGLDADKDTISYELWYCPNEEEFVNIAANITETKYTVNLDQYPGGDNAYFYLYATDGINTSEAGSDEFAAKYKAPEIISKQDKVPEFKLTDEILFDADVYDMQDGWLYADEEITWTYKNKTYTTGSLLWVYPYELSPGEHTFTLTAKNSQGVTSAKDFKFKVLDDESALPNDWSKEDVKKALKNGFVAPLSNVNAAITRGQFAKLMGNLYWTMWEKGSPDPDYEENVVTDCGQDDYDPFLMVKLGAMDAPGGKFNPNGNVTQEEAAVIMYKICNIADPKYMEKLSTDKEMVDACMELGVMEASGDNAYGASEKITGRLALVRCNRLFDAIFES